MGTEGGKGEEFEIFGFEDEENKMLILFICIVVSCLTLVRLLYEKTRMKRIIPESALLVLLGIAIGAVIAISTSQQSLVLEDYFTFPPDLFLYVFVPVIIFDATYFLNKHAFFKNFVEIVTYAAIGTLLSTLIIGLLYIAIRKAVDTEFNVSELLTFSSLVSAVDPVAVIAIMESMHVNENLFNLVFGESTLNDGVAIVLFNLFKGIESLQQNGNSIQAIVLLGIVKFVVSVFGAIILATTITFVFCLITRISHRIVNTQPLLFLVCAMFCYILADMLLFSGIIAVMTCALILVRYGEYNLTEKSIDSFTTMTHMLAQTFETMLFLDMGFQVSFILKAEEQIDWLFSLTIIPFTILARTTGTLLQTYFLNKRRVKLGQKVSWQEQIIMIFCGLRGGIAFALAKSWELNKDQKNQMLFATCTIILFTILVYGLTMRPMIKLLKIKLEISEHTGHDFACKTLLKPAANMQHFVNSVMGRRTRWQKALHTVDVFLQKIFLNSPMPMDRELIENVRQIQQLHRERTETEQKVVQHAKSFVMKKRPSFVVHNRPRRSFVMPSRKKYDQEIIVTQQMYGSTDNNNIIL